MAAEMITKKAPRLRMTSMFTPFRKQCGFAGYA